MRQATSSCTAMVCRGSRWRGARGWWKVVAGQQSSCWCDSGALRQRGNAAAERQPLSQRVRLSRCVSGAACEAECGLTKTHAERVQGVKRARWTRAMSDFMMVQTFSKRASGTAQRRGALVRRRGARYRAHTHQVRGVGAHGVCATYRRWR